MRGSRNRRHEKKYTKQYVYAGNTRVTEIVFEISLTFRQTYSRRLQATLRIFIPMKIRVSQSMSVQADI